MPFVDSAGWKVWYEAGGSGPPLVLCGGPIMMHNQFDDVREGLRRDFRTIDWNWRGAGQSERTWMTGITFDDWVDDMTRVMDQLRVEKAHFWGGSTGSLFAIRFARRHPDRVGKLVLFPVLQGGSSEGGAFRAELVRRQGVERQIWNAYWVATSAEAFQTGRILALIEREIEIAKRNLPAEISNRVSNVYLDLDLRPDVAGLRMPVMLLVGGSGRNGTGSPTVRANIEAFRSLCPQAVLEVVEAAGGTLTMIEQPERSLAAVRRFLLG